VADAAGDLTAGAEPELDLHPTLPAGARTPINRCNLPPIILGSLTYQRFPVRLDLDGVYDLHRDLFQRLERLGSAADRAHQFIDYTDVHFLLNRREDVGWRAGTPKDRSKADYRKLIRGWMFDPDGLAAAVLKGWVESRFGLVPRHHHGPIRSTSDPNYLAYREAWAAGLYNTNALEAQLDLLYTYCQYEVHRTCADRNHVRLYRGVNRIDEHEVLGVNGRRRTVIVNSLTSFTLSRERADEFGDYILTADVPLPKIAFFSEILPGLLQGEDEYAVIGGVYEVELSTV
jgi:NAD+--dinitrogen-reductase ADP-D-ribosyltransferase